LEELAFSIWSTPQGQVPLISKSQLDDIHEIMIHPVVFGDHKNIYDLQIQLDGS
jgi:hypothetical protein